jgi:UDP-N-acetylmuramate dehydrogenase
MTPSVSENVSLKPYNTFGIDVSAAFFATFNSVEELQLLLQTNVVKQNSHLVMGGGSNMLLTKNFDGIVLKNSIQGIEILDEDANTVHVKVGAGEVWHHFVMWAVNKNLGGVENLSLIPGSVGAGPIQNIGAYGVELKDCFKNLEAVEIKTGNVQTFTKDDCNFGYRYSIFKDSAKDKYIITHVIFSLKKNPSLNTTYGAIEQELKKQNATPSIKTISDAVIAIRQSKLPDPAVLGNAGSFFKNPEVPVKKFEELKAVYPTLTGYPVSESTIKLAAGWLIEQCGWKGKRIGNTGSHKDQALVLVNYGNATGKEIYSLALDIKKSVYKKFGVDIEPEVNVI